MDLLDEEEIEATLLGWTDDEEADNDVIDESDEELLLSDPIIIAPVKKQLSDVTDQLASANAIKNVKEIDDSTISNSKIDQLLDVTITQSDEVGLDVTLNTRDILDVSVCNEHDNSEDLIKTTLEKTDSLIGHGVTMTTMDVLDVSMNKENEGAKATAPCSTVAESVDLDVTINTVSDPCDTSFCDVNGKSNVNGSITEMQLQSCDISVPDCVDPALTVVEVADSSVDMKTESTLAEPQPVLGTQEHGKVTTSSIVDINVTDSMGAESTVTSSSEQLETKQTSNNEPAKEVKADVRTAIVSPLPQNSVLPVKRVKSLSDEQQSATKRSRCSSEPTAASGSKTFPQTTNTENSATSSDNTKNSPKKKSVVSFNYKNYSKNSATDPYVCTSCSMKFKEDSKFESHLVANHAMSLIINDFDIDIHQYYKQKREKIISQVKPNLPRLTLQEGVVDRALLNDYTANVKYVGQGNKAQFFCKICENLYCTRNIIIEHLKSSKHILRKNAQ